MNPGAWVDFLAGIWEQWMLPMAWQVTFLALIVWVATCMLGKTSATFRHALWLVVFLRLILPPTLAVPWSIGGAVNTFHIELAASPHNALTPFPDPTLQTSPPPLAQSNGGVKAPTTKIHPVMIATLLWLAVSLSLFTLMILQYRKYARKIMQDCVIADPHISAIAEVQQTALHVRCRPAIFVSPHIKIPAVIGVWHPIILLPESINQFPERQITNVIGHELAHVRRHDVLIGWCISLLLCAYWFHPVVWLANLFIRREREMACDDAVLYATKQEGKEYAATIVHMAESFDHTVPVSAGFLGMLELSDNLLLRIRSTMDATRARRFTWRSGLALCLFMVLFIPMGVWQPPAQAEPATTAASNEKTVAEKPKVVSCTPANGATEVDPALDKIAVTFDQDMASGFSWTGGPPNFPETTGKPKWVDLRTCVMPVRLEAGRFYRFGINSSSYQNFKSKDNLPVEPQVISFTTQGADAKVLDAQTPPKVVVLTPANGAKDVDPAITKIAVTFDRPMGSGMSWVQDDQYGYPETTGKVTWSEDHLTCTMPVKLNSQKSYQIWLNEGPYNNFQSTQGVPLTPVKWTFETK